MEPQSVDSLADALQWTVAKSPFPKVRNGSQAIGTTLERILDTDGPDTPWTPDLGVGIELKTHDTSSGTPLTLFCREPEPGNRKCWNGDLVSRYGAETDDGANQEVGVYGQARSSDTFEVEVTERKLTVYGADGQYCAHFNIDTLVKSALKKLRHLAVVGGEKVTLEDGEKGYKYTEAVYYSDPVEEEWREAFRDGRIELHFRMGTKDSGENRNHGSAWRIQPMHLDSLYDTKVDLLDPDCDLSEIPLPQQTLGRVDQTPNYSGEGASVQRSQGRLDEF